MDLRCDAIAGAAEWISTVERAAQAVPGLVATVGKIEAKPGAVNVIAAEARLSLDVRHSADDIRTRTVGECIREAQQIAARRGLSVRDTTLLNQRAVANDPGGKSSRRNDISADPGRHQPRPRGIGCS